MHDTYETTMYTMQHIKAEVLNLLSIKDHLQDREYTDDPLMYLSWIHFIIIFKTSERI